MNIEPNRLLSKEFLERLTANGFRVEADQTYGNASFLEGPIHFNIHHVNLPKVPVDTYGRHPEHEPYALIQNAHGETPRIEINIWNRNKPNHDATVARQVVDMVGSLDVSKVVMVYTDDSGHGLYGMPYDMRERYDYVEKIIVQARCLARELKPFCDK